MGKLGIALLVVAMAIGMVSFATVPARAANVSLSLYGSASMGWGTSSSSESNPGVTLTVNQGDVVTITLHSTDGFPHQLLIDYNGNGVADPGEPVSASFTTTTTLPAFSAARAGSFPYLCLAHPDAMKGTFVVQGSASTPPNSNPGDQGTLLIVVGVVLGAAVVAGVSVLVLRSRH